MDPPPPPDPGQQEEPSLRSTPVTAPVLKKGGRGSRIDLEKPRPAFTLGTRSGTPASRSKFHGRCREGGHTGKRPDARPVVQARRGSSGVVGSPLRLQARAARAPLALGPAKERSGAHAGGGGVAGGVGVAIAGAQAGAPAKRSRIGPKVAQETSSAPPAWLTLRGWPRGPEGSFDPPPPP